MSNISPRKTKRSRPGIIKRLASRLSARFHIAFGLTSLLSTLVLCGYFLGFIPDKAAEQRQHRVVLSEALTSSGSVLLRRGDLDGIRRVLEFSVERNDDLLGVELHREWNNQNINFGEVPSETDAGQLDAVAKDRNQVTVPLLRGGSTWGELRFHFAPTGARGGVLGAWDVAKSSLLGFMLFVSLLGFPAVYFYLGKVLKQLDPKAAVPGRVRSALDSIAECLVVLDRSGQLVLANAAFSTLSGRSAESLLGESIDSLDWITDKDAPVDAPWHRSLESGETVHQAMAAYRDTDGQRRSFMVNCSPVLGAEGQIGGILISMDDVTRLEEQEAALREAMVLAEEASVAKSAFLSNMSHEIRTPLTAILGFTELLRRGSVKTPQEQARHLQTISNSGTHLLGLINDLLDLSKVEAGSMEVEVIKTGFVDIAFDVAEILKIKADEKGVDLEVEVATDLPEHIASDPSRLRQIITNLVGNAIKFTEVGAVQIRLSCDPVSETCLISVVDSGIGMDEEQQARIFDAFTQADVTVTRRFGGTGLGLSISRSLAEALGGRITVESEPGVGSIFHLMIPTGDLAEVSMLTEDDIVSRVNDAQVGAGVTWQFPDATVLVVDDAAENRELLSLVLSGLGIQVRIACNGQEAVDAVEEGGLDAVLMDLQMPVMDGYEAAGVMRERGVTLPLVGLTADAMRGIEERVLAAGFSHYQTKPIDIDALTNLLAKLLGGVQVESEQVHSEAPGQAKQLADVESNLAYLPPASGFSDTATDTPVVSTLLQGDSRFAGIVERFMPRLDEQLLAMQSAIQENDLQEVASIAHWLKGSGGNVGFDGFTKISGSLQAAAQNGDTDEIRPLMSDIEAYAARVRSGWAEFENVSANGASGAQRFGT